METDLLSTSRHNRVAFTTADGSALPADLALSLSVGLVNSGIVRYEAEKATITGSATRNATHVGGIDNPGTALTFEELVIDEDGDYTLRFYYAAPLGLATHTVYVDGVKRGVVRYNDNGKSLGWGSFSEDIYADIHLSLTAGNHTLRIEKTKADIGFAELDAFDLISCTVTGGIPLPPPEDGDEPAKPADPDGDRYEVENGKVLGAAANRGTHVGGIDKAGDGVELTVTVKADGTYTLRIYHTAPAGKATHTLSVDGDTKGTVIYGGTQTGWGVFDPANYAEITVSLTQGTHTLRIEKTEADVGFAELDAIDQIPCALTGGVPTKDSKE
jgi:hypothetical protein